jgi:hypothetical protein
MNAIAEITSAATTWPEAFTIVGIVFGFAAMMWVMNR